MSSATGMSQIGWIEKNIASLQEIDSSRFGVMAKMGEEGDLKVIWDKSKADEVAAAEEQFKAMKKKGYAAFSVKKDGEKNEVINKFDPNAEMIILAPPVVGG
jgi:hypothetical protein